MKLIITIIVTLFLSTSLFASELTFKFGSPSFSGVGKSSHYLTIENIEKTRRDAIEAQKKADAKALKAECTPEFYLYDTNGVLVYRGRLDDASPGNVIKPTGKDLRGALNSLLSGKSITEHQYPSMGCSIKWRE